MEHRRQTAMIEEEIQASWIAGHLYYHQSLDQVVRGFVHPLVVSLVQSGKIDSFFFLRHGLGGPHVRLRLRAIPGAHEYALEAMQEAAQRFLAFAPSAQPIDEETIRRSNERLLAGDPSETDDAIYPDNSFRLTPFRPEIERYGGPKLLCVSLDLFMLSSVAALEFLLQQEDVSRSVQLTQAFRLLLSQAIAFAADETELGELLRYGVDSWGGILPKVVEKGDRIARSHANAFGQLFSHGLAEARSVKAGREPLCRGADLLVAGVRRLSAAIGTVDRTARLRIGCSQLHMTASRLGLANAEEVYISRLLSVILSELLARSGEDLAWIRQMVAERVPRNPQGTLGGLLARALTVLAGTPEIPSATEESAG